MPDTLHEQFKKQIRQVKFERTIGLFGATTMGVGALKGAGIYVLIGIAAGAAGPSVILSFLICGALAFLTTLMFAEFSRIVPRSGGGYIYVYDSLGGMAGFATGWFLALGSIFACGLFAIGFAEYAISFTGLQIPRFAVKLIAVAIVLGLGYVNIRPAKNLVKIQAWLTWGNVGVLAVLIFFSIFHMNLDNITPVFPKGFGGTTMAISLIYVSFFGYQLIANNADEIIKPEQTVPKAMKLSMLISMSVYLVVAIVAVMAVSWETLASSNAPLVALATKSFGGKGWLLISFGGVLASLGSLNSTIISQSRQVYVMGTHRLFPDLLGKLDEKTKKPKFALLTGAILIACVLLFFDLEFIAKSANFCLLVSLIPVSIALRKIYLKDPSKRPAKKWKQILPELALIANLALLFTLDLVSLAFGQQLALAGAAIYFFYSRKREKRSRSGVNISLKETGGLALFPGSRIMAPMANPETQQALFTVSNALLAKKGGEIVVLSVKDVPEHIDFYEALSDAGETLEVIKRSMEHAEEKNTRISPVVRASRNVATGIIEAAEEAKSDLIIMGYADHRYSGKANVMDKVMRFSVTDMAFLKLSGTHMEFIPKEIALCLRGKANLDLMIMIATSLAEAFKGRITLLHILPPKYSKNQKSRADRIIVETIQKLNSIALFDVQLRVAIDPLKELVALSGRFDLMLIGALKSGLSEKSISSSFAKQFTEQANCSVIVVKEVPGYRKLIGKI